MGDVAHKALAGNIDRLQLIRHIVEGDCQLGDLIVPCHRRAGGQISVAEALGGRGDPAQRPASRLVRRMDRMLETNSMTAAEMIKAEKMLSRKAVSASALREAKR